MKNENELEELPSLPVIKDYNACMYCINHSPNFTCPKFLKCDYQRKYKANVVVHDYGDKKEILIFKDAFWQRGGIEVNENVDRTRKFIYDSNGVLVPKNENEELIFALLNRLKDSRKRGLQNMYSIINSNEWNYWVTITIENTKIINKYDDEVVKNIWKSFREKLQYNFKDIYIIVVPEYHKKGGLHFHGLIGGCNFDKYLTRAVNSKIEYRGKENECYCDYLYTDFGDQIYNFDTSIYDKGLVTIVKMRKGDKLQIANYMGKYMGKESCVKYNKKSYYHTRNCKVGNSFCSYHTNEEKQRILQECNLLNVARFVEKDKLYSIWLDEKEYNKIINKEINVE